MFKEVVEGGKRILSDWPELIEALQTLEGPNGTKFNLENVVPGTSVVLLWLDERVLALGNLLKSLEGVKVDGGAPLPKVYSDGLRNQFNNLDSQVNSLKTNIGSVNTNGGVNSLDPASWVVTVKNTNQSINFASLLQNLNAAIEAVLVDYFKVSQIVHAPKFNAFSEAVREFSTKAKGMRGNATRVKRFKADIETTKVKAERILKDISDNKDTSDIYLTDIANNLGNSKNNKNTIQTHLDEVETLSQKASILETEVQGYEIKFEEFQNTLSDRNKEFAEWSKNANSLKEKLDGQKSEIERITQQAELMLKGATNAGLAATFNDALNKIDENLKGAKKAFYWAIGFLFVSAVPLAGYVFLSLKGGSLIGIESEQSIWTNLYFNPFITFAFALLMIPTAWLAKFSASRHHQLFQLKEHYQYKYSLAMAVDGFKKQAPEHADAIAAETFNRLLFNPADRLNGVGEADGHPSPLMNWLMNKLGFNAKGIKE